MRCRSIAARALCAVLAAFLFMLAGPTAFADTSSQMDGYWSSSLGAVSATGPTAYQGQQAGYYTMGNLSFRNPQQNLRLAGVQMPAISAGCGGIDIFTGGFSFINADQLVAEMKAVATNAVGYGFNLALKSLCPVCHTIMDQLQHIAQQVNASQISSCQAASALVDSVAGAMDANNHQLCQDLGTYHGLFSDQVQGWAKCQASSTSTLASLPASDQAFIPTKKNIGWEAVKQIQGLTGDMDYAAMAMTMTGTVVENCQGDGAGGCSYSYIQPAGNDAALLTAMLDGGSFQAIACDEYTACLNPTAGGRTINISPSSGFKAKVSALLVDMVSKIMSRQPLTSQEQVFLNMSPLPIYKMASVYTVSQGALAQNTLSGYTDLIATNVAIEFVKSSIQKIAAGAHNLQGVDQKQLDDWSRNTSATVLALNDQETKVAAQVSAYEQVIDRTQRVEQTLAGALSSRFAQSYTFMRDLAPA